jgi:hypothetical protein
LNLHIDLIAEFDTFVDAIKENPECVLPAASSDLQRLLYVAYCAGFAHGIKGLTVNIGDSVMTSLVNIKEAMRSHLHTVLTNENERTVRVETAKQTVNDLMDAGLEGAARYDSRNWQGGSKGFTACETADCGVCGACQDPLCPYCERSLSQPAPVGCPMNHAHILQQVRA